MRFANLLIISFIFLFPSKGYQQSRVLFPVVKVGLTFPIIKHTVNQESLYRAIPQSFNVDIGFNAEINVVFRKSSKQSIYSGLRFDSYSYKNNFRFYFQPPDSFYNLENKVIHGIFSIPLGYRIHVNSRFLVDLSLNPALGIDMNIKQEVYTDNPFNKVPVKNFRNMNFQYNAVINLELYYKLWRQVLTKTDFIGLCVGINYLLLKEKIFYSNDDARVFLPNVRLSYSGF